MFGFLRKKKTKSTSGVVQVKEQEQMSQAQLLQTIKNLEQQIMQLRSVAGTPAVAESSSVGSASEVIHSNAEKIIEGVFDGQNMIGSDGQQYDVPANYASKSKLVEGDILKLTINNLGAFVYKQIRPIERKRIVGLLEQDPQNLQFYAVADNKKWRLLTASVTYYKGEDGDEVVFLIPKDTISRWAAVENIIKQ